MTTKIQQLKKGDKIVLSGESLILAETSKVLVKSELSPEAKSDSPEHSLEAPKMVVKEKVLQIVQSAIKKVERQEQAMLMSTDDLDFEEMESSDFSFIDHVGTANQVLYLRQVLQALKAL